MEKRRNRDAKKTGKIFPFASSRIGLEHIDWRKISAIHCARSNTSGVFFLCQANGAFVVKGSADVVS